MDIGLTLKEVKSKLEAKELSSLDVVKECLKRIKKVNPKYHSFITVLEKQALTEAVQRDKERAKGVKKPLLGIPVGIKDNFLTKGIRTTASSKVLDDYLAQYDSTSVKRLKDAGAVIIGKTNLDAWGHGSSGEHTDYGETHNPYAFDRVTGGSSSGSGAAVAAGLCFMGTGSDTGGSNRQPGCYCNVVGYKPTYGRVSRFGVIAMASSTDSIGHLTKTVWDSGYVLNITAGHDPYDATSSDNLVEDFVKDLEKPMRVKIGIPKEFFKGLESDYANSIMKALKILEKKGNKLTEISIPSVKYAYPVYCLTTFSEISSNLARFDGVRYGNGRSFFADEARRRIMIGTHSLQAGYADKYYKKGMKARTVLINQYKSAFEKVDIVAGPVYPFPPFKIGEREKDPLKMYLSDVLVCPANITGNPGISIPIEFVHGLPNGLQLVARHFEEKLMFNIANQLEQEMPMYKVLPDLTN